MTRLLSILVLCLIFTVSAKDHEIGNVLDSFHLAASEANSEEYFSLLDENLVFMGTDATERWSKAELKAFAEPYFSKGTGWTYIASSRNISLSSDGKMAWFDEVLQNESYGTCRGTGVLVKSGGDWKIIQYNLTIPIPNKIAKQVVKQIRKSE